MIYPLKIRYVMVCIDLTITLGCIWYHYFLSQIYMPVNLLCPANSCFWMGLLLLIWWFAYSCMSQVVCNYCICTCAELLFIFINVATWCIAVYTLHVHWYSYRPPWLVSLLCQYPLEITTSMRNHSSKFTYQTCQLWTHSLGTIFS